jgi:superfamily I DNA and/or RNA helicase
VPEIIAYCNDLVYKGKLQPCRKESEEEQRNRPVFLPPLGEIEIRADDERAAGSRRNEREAARIAEWTKEYLEALEKRYEKKIGEILGIVTPFTAQKKAVQKALAGVLGRDAGIVVGTVHALQGAERDVVLFSPVYGQGHSGNTFFDAGPNMMNVAVSRARDSFIVIGNPDLFSEGSGKPSGILARHLRKKKTEVFL